MSCIKKQFKNEIPCRKMNTYRTIIFRSVKLTYDTVIMGTSYYAFTKIYRTGKHKEWMDVSVKYGLLVNNDNV